MAQTVSLANKCQLLFGAAVVLIITAALVIPAIRLSSVVDQSQLETSRQIARLWSTTPSLREPVLARRLPPGAEGEAPESELLIRYWPLAAWETEAHALPFLQRAKREFGRSSADNPLSPEHAEAGWEQQDRVYRYARVIEDDAMKPLGVVFVERRSTTAAGQLLINRSYLFLAGLVAGLLALVVFYLITSRIILSPVRTLRDTAQAVRLGGLNARAQITTGDEFEQLGEAFNSMLEDLGDQQTQLRAINRSLDLKLTELSERNTALYEAARLKGEFLANISHELRTPLNSIIGFGEILQDIANADASDTPPDEAALAKRRRYIGNLLNAARTLLVMIEELLAMAKIEAGKVELHPQTMNIAETCEGLVALIRPLADRKTIRLTLQLQSERGGSAGFSNDAREASLPVIETDPQKFQQVIFNFLSNAVKFTPDQGEVTLRAERLAGGDGVPMVRVSVLDTGPGIPRDQHAFIFEKFNQIEAGHTRRHAGTGLGLAIAKEYAELLQGQIQLVSEPGRGSMFSFIVPLALNPVLLQRKRADATRAPNATAPATSTTPRTQTFISRP